jgi:glycine hydroxymethyltransferase
VATKLHPDPIPYCEFVTTTTHKTLRGPRGGMIMMREDWAKKINSKIFPGIQGGPLMHIIAAKAVAFKEDLEPSYRSYCEQILKNAKTLGEVLVGADFDLVSGGTDNHLLLVDLSNKPYTGKDAEEALERAGITVNKNTVPNEKRSPFITSGIRIGTPAVTTRGLKEAEIKLVGAWIAKILNDIGNENLQRQIQGQVRELCAKFPIYR